VWLDAELTSPYAFYQYWLNVADDDAERFLKMFSWRSLDEIGELVTSHRAAAHERIAQRALAEDLTTFVHGAEATRRAAAASQVMFGGSLDGLGDADLSPLLADVPSSTLERAVLEQGIALVDLLATTDLADSKGAARRLVSGGGVYVNNLRETDPARTLKSSDLGTETMIILRAGKKRYHIVQVR
jgi:tyrosyl-tRNA synthetase